MISIVVNLRQLGIYGTHALYSGEWVCFTGTCMSSRVSDTHITVPLRFVRYMFDGSDPWLAEASRAAVAAASACCSVGCSTKQPSSSGYMARSACD